MCAQQTLKIWSKIHQVPWRQRYNGPGRLPAGMSDSPAQPAASSSRGFRFTGFTLDLLRGCLIHEGREVKLRPKSFEVLKYLVERSGRLVSRAELMQAIWPDTSVTEESLAQCLMEVRRALQDDSQR